VAFDLVVVVEASAVRCGAAVGGDGDLLGEDKTKSAGGTCAKVHEVEVV
jgi:hypothetical protein